MMKKNYFWIDLLKAVAAFAVILLHVCVPIVYDFSASDWNAGNFYNSLSRFSVPVFVMVSGALLLGKTEDLNVFLKKRFLRLIVPFLFWSLIYLFWKIDLNQSLPEIFSFASKSLKNGTEFHLWYVYMIIGLYLFIPILSKWTTVAPRKEFIYFMSIWVFVIALNLPIVNKFYTRINFCYFMGYIGYLVLGFYLFKYSFKRNRIVGWTLFLLGSTITVLGTHYLSALSNKFDGYFYNFLSFNVALAATGIFLLCKEIKVEKTAARKAIEVISKYSYGIYLSHIFVLNGVGYFGFGYQVMNPWLGILLLAVVVLVLSTLLTFIMSKIPFIGKYISG